LSPKTWTIWTVAAIALFFLYFFGLARTGLLGPDEPRYAAIGRQMAQSGDWVTPRLNGAPWFEKPPLLYWTTAVGFAAGLGDDLAPRLPVAVLSVAFLVFYFFLLRREFGERAAGFSTCSLVTSAGWLASSHIAVPDLPMAAAFATAMLLALREDRAHNVGAAICLGIAIMAKGLVPLALFLPAIWFWRRRAVMVMAFAVLIALPWYVLVTVANGTPFLYEFFWRQHFERFTNGTLMHIRPIWFYLPVLLAGMFPWTPTLALVFGRETYKDRRMQYLAVWFLFGFVLLSAAKGKLPGYLLPLLPALAALCGVALAEARKAAWVLACCAGLLWLLPAIEQVLPRALISGLSRVPLQWPLTAVIPVGAVAVLCWFLDRGGRRGLAVAAISLCVTASVAGFVWRMYPMLDNTVSARGFYRSQREMVCTPSPNRNWRYGLDYYAHHPIPDCK